MKTRVFRSFCLVVFATVLAMTSCRDQDFVFEEHYPGEEIKKEYEQNWVKQMGAIDPEQDWCMAGEYSVTVNVPGVEDVKVYALNPEGEYRLVGEYFGVSGTQTLKFDAIKGTKDLLVSTSNGFKKTVVDGEVGFEMGTRAYSKNNVNVELVNDYLIFTNTDINESWLPKCERWLSGYTSLGAPNYIYVPQTPEVYFFPLYWNTSWFNSSTDKIGIYNANNTSERIEIFSTVSESHLSHSENSGKLWSACRTNNSYNNNDKTEYKSQGIKVTIPDSWNAFGIYVENYVPFIRNEIFYSQSKENTLNAIKCGTFTDDKSNRILCLGDELNGKVDRILLRIEGASIVNENLQSWCVACEDLGDTGDYDFNDLVFKFEKTYEGTSVDATYKLKITPLAAGGTLEAQYGFDGVVHKEIHAAFGKTQKVNGKYLMLNTNAGSGEGVDNVSPLDAGKIIKEYGTTNFNVATELQKFFIRVGGANATMEDSPTPDYEEKNGSYTITAPKKGSAPQMIIVPDSWQWPSERTSILDAYPGFTDWSSDKTNTDWAGKKYSGPDAEKFFYSPSSPQQ